MVKIGRAENLVQKSERFVSFNSIRTEYNNEGRNRIYYALLFFNFLNFLPSLPILKTFQNTRNSILFAMFFWLLHHESFEVFWIKLGKHFFSWKSYCFQLQSYETIKSFEYFLLFLAKSLQILWRWRKLWRLQRKERKRRFIYLSY